MTSELNNSQINNQSAPQIKEDIPYYQTQEYQTKILKFMKESQSLQFKKDRTQAVSTLKSSRHVSTPSIQFSPENIQRWLGSPSYNEGSLRGLSNFLYDTNALYRWTITTMANMPTWSNVLSMDTYGSKKSREDKEKAYRQGLKYISDKNIPYEMNKAFLISLKNDFFYGYEVEQDGYYFVMNLDPNYCRINRQVGDGIFGFQFNFSFFDSRLNMDERSEIIDSYPPEFRQKYNMYRTYSGTPWINLDVDNTICLKMNDEILYGIPYYANLFPLLLDVEYYKDLGRERAEMDNFLLLHQHIPVDENAMDKFAINLDLARGFDSAANAVLQEGVKLFTSPMKVTAVKTERTNNDNQSIKNATSQVFTGSGLPQQLSNTESSTSAGISKAIMVNEQIVYRFYRQVEKVYNYKLKNKFSNSKLQFRFQDITNFSKEDKVSSTLKLAQNGIAPASHVATASGESQYEFYNDVDMEHDILGITHKLRPLLTSHTMSGNDVEAHTGGVGNEGGRPPMADGDLSDAGDVTRDNEANVRE